MNCIPVIIRELRLAAYKAFTYYGRSLTALAAILIVLQFLLGISIELIKPAQIGTYLFVVFAFMGYLYCLFSGVLATADCISKEKREDTLGLLYLTELKSYDIVFGKVFSRCFRIFSFLIATAPAPALTFFLGGVDLTNYLWLVLSQANTLFFFASLGMVISVFTSQSAIAISLSLGLGLVIGMLVPALLFLKIQLTGMATSPWVATLLPLPAGTVVASMASMTGQSLPWAYGISTSWILVHTEAWLLLLLAACRLYREMRHVPSAKPKLSWLSKSISWPIWNIQKKPAIGPNSALAHISFDVKDRQEEGTDSSLSGTLIDTTLAKEKSCEVTTVPISEFESNPESHPLMRMNQIVHKKRGATFWLSGIMISVFFIFLGNFFTSSAPGIVGLFFLGCALIYFLMEFDLARQSTHFLSEMHLNGMLELILVTPISIEQLIKSHMLYLRKQYATSVQLVAAGCLILMAAGVIIRGFDTDALMVTFGLWSVFTFMLGTDLYAISWIGLWQGLKQKQVNRALSRALLLVIVMPWLVFLAGFTWLYVIVPQPLIGLFGFVWLFVSRLANHAFWTAWAINQLYDQFQEMAIVE